MEDKRAPAGRTRDTAGRFTGPRDNVENVPRLPTLPARWVLEDPRRRPYLVFWVSDDEKIAWALKMAPTQDADVLLVTLESGQTQRLMLLRRPLPLGTGDALFYRCPSCERPRRYLYRQRSSLTGLVDCFGLQCQRCARLRFKSQGHYRGVVFRWLISHSGEKFPRWPWDPRAVSHPRLVALAGLLNSARRLGV
jgi:hypothetical protein